MADGDDVGPAVIGGGRSDSGRLYDGTAGSELEIIGTMPSGVDWREPVR